MERPIRIHLPLARLPWALAFTVSALASVSLTVHYSALLGTLDPESLWVNVFSLSLEHNLPTWYSATLLFSCGALLATIAVGAKQAGQPGVRHWGFLAAVFVYMSLDEAIMLHEYLSLLFDFGGIFFYGWVIPAGIAVTLMGVAYLRFVLGLPARTRTRFILAGTCYVGGALIVELALGWWAERNGTHNVGYMLIDAVEESLEIMGLSIFLYALLDYLAGETGQLDLTIGGAPDADSVVVRGMGPG